MHWKIMRRNILAKLPYNFSDEISNCIISPLVNTSVKKEQLFHSIKKAYK